jgi:mannitol-1-phosphate 5-dehydrogenase
MPKAKIALFGCSRINLGLIGPLFSQASNALVAINARDRGVVDAIARARSYRLLISAGKDSKTVRVPVQRSIHYDAHAGKTLANEAVIREAATADVIVSGVARTPQMLAELTIPFLLSVIEHRVANRVDSPLDICGAENPMLGRTSSELIEGMLFRTVRYAGLSRHVRERVRFPRLVPDRVSPFRRVLPLVEGDEVEVTTEHFRQLVVAGASWNFERSDLLNVPGVSFEPSADRFAARKVLLFGLVHSLIGYQALLLGCTTIDEAVTEPNVQRFVLEAIRPVMAALSVESKLYNGRPDDYARQIFDRLGTTGLRDSPSRVCRDAPRKLGRFDRIIGPALLLQARRHAVPDAIISSAAAMLMHCYRQFCSEGRSEGAAAPRSDATDDHTLCVGRGLADSPETVFKKVLDTSGLHPSDPPERRLAEEITAAFLRLRGRSIASRAGRQRRASG